ncbi:hypothetical protein DFJ74DRAFT_691912 [Hyaloraphidium curvatum]|nr:hypothetical protein DFJ74DRAFT_691912 [Hyaloraphidium curvatum]
MEAVTASPGGAEWAHLVHAEVVNVVGAMRRNQRWSVAARPPFAPADDGFRMSWREYARVLADLLGKEGVAQGADAPEPEQEDEGGDLLAEFARLRVYLEGVKELESLDPILLLHPFLLVIRSGDTSGPITGAALSSVERFVFSGILTPPAPHPNLPRAVANLISAVTRCKFEATDAVSDEVVLGRILKLLRTVAAGLGQWVDDRGMCEMVEAGLGMCFQGRVSELLRRSAEDTLVLLIRSLADRLPSALDEAESPSSSTPTAFRPFSLPSILESLRVLVSIIDPRNRHTHTDSVHRVVALGLLCTFVENAGGSVGRWVRIGRGVLEKGRERERIKRIEKAAGKGPVVEAAKEEGTGESDEERGRTREVKETVNTDPAAVDGAPEGAPAESAGEAAEDGTAPAADADKEKSKDSAPLEIHLDTGPAPDAEPSPELGEELQPSAEMPPPYEGDDAVHAPAAQLLSDDMPRFLFYLLRTDHLTFASPPTPVHLTVLQLTLRCLAGLFATARGELKGQYGWLVTSVISRGDQGVVAWDVEGGTGSSEPEEAKASGSGPVPIRASHTVFPVTGEVRELLLETLLQFARVPSFAAELWVNFDGDPSSPGHLFEDAFKFLSRHGFPDVTPGGPVTTPIHQSLCLDSLLLFLKHMVERRGDASATATDGSALPTPDQLRENKLRKKQLAEGAEKFNVDPKEGIAHLQVHGFVPTPPTPESIAAFLLTTPGVSKKLIGDYISKPSNVDVLKAFIGQYDFSGRRIDEALRLMLEGFRLPGEAQQIERIMENFAERYFSSLENAEGKEIETQDATFVLAYSVIMLNTDQHNPQVRRRMTLEDFQRNTRGVNNGKNFSPDYLSQIYDAIRERAIVMPEEHDGELGLNYAWKELLKRAAAHGNSMLIPSVATNAYDKDMVEAVWPPTVAAISYAFDNAEDDTNLQKAVYGFYCLAVLAAHYGLTDLFDNVVVSLARSTGLLRGTAELSLFGNASPSTASVPGEARREGTDRWIVDFGRNHKGQVAAVLLFGIASEHGNSIRGGWKHLLDCVGNLFLHQLLSPALTTAEDFVKGSVPVPTTPLPGQQFSRKQEARSDRGGLFSALGQILALRSSQDDDRLDEPTDEEVRMDRVMQEVVNSCRIEDIFAESRFLEEGSLKSLIQQAVQASIADPNAAILPQVAMLRAEYAGSRPISRSPAPNNRAEKPSPSKTVTPPMPLPESNTASPSVKYNAAAAFFLDIMVNVVIQNRDRVKTLWPIVFDHINTILTNSAAYPPLLVERAVVSLLRLSIRVAHKEEMVEDVCRALELLRSLPQDVMNSVAEQMMAGILVLIKSSESTVTVNPAFTEPILSLLSVATLHPDAAKYAFDAVTILLSDSTATTNGAVPSGVGVNPDNFGEFVDVLINFSAAAGIVFAQASAVEEAPASQNWNGRASPRSKQPPNPMKSPIVQGAIERAVKACDRLYKLHGRIPKLMEQKGIRAERAWFEFWLPILSGLGQQCYHPCRDVRQSALTYLQRALLSPELEQASGDKLDCWVDSFENVLFPLLDELLKPEVFRLDAAGMDETRMRAAGLLSKIFLQYLNRLSRWMELPHLWERILQYMVKYMQSGTGEYLHEAVVESLKNMLLVMSTQGMFQPRSENVDNDPAGNLWDVTWTFLSPFLPNLKDELFPPGPPEDTERPGPEAGSVKDAGEAAHGSPPLANAADEAPEGAHVNGVAESPVAEAAHESATDGVQTAEVGA